MPKLNLTRWIMTAEVPQVQAVQVESGDHSGTQAVELSAGVKKKPWGSLITDAHTSTCAAHLRSTALSRRPAAESV